MQSVAIRITAGVFAHFTKVYNGRILCSHEGAEKASLMRARGIRCPAIPAGASARGIVLRITRRRTRTREPYTRFCEPVPAGARTRASYTGYLPPKQNSDKILNSGYNIGMSKQSDMTPRQLARELGVHPVTVAKWRKAGCPYMESAGYFRGKTGSRPRYNLEAVKGWIAEQQQKENRKGKP